MKRYPGKLNPQIKEEIMNIKKKIETQSNQSQVLLDQVFVFERFKLKHPTLISGTQKFFSLVWIASVV